MLTRVRVRIEGVLAGCSVRQGGAGVRTREVHRTAVVRLQVAVGVVGLHEHVVAAEALACSYRVRVTAHGEAGQSPWRHVDIARLARHPVRCTLQYSDNRVHQNLIRASTSLRNSNVAQRRLCPIGARATARRDRDRNRSRPRVSVGVNSPRNRQREAHAGRLIASSRKGKITQRRWRHVNGAALFGNRTVRNRDGLRTGRFQNELVSREGVRPVVSTHKLVGIQGVVCDSRIPVRALEVNLAGVVGFLVSVGVVGSHGDVRAERLPSRNRTRHT